MTGTTYPDTIDTKTEKWYKKPIYFDIVDNKAISRPNWELFAGEMQRSVELIIPIITEISPHSSSVEP